MTFDLFRAYREQPLDPGDWTRPELEGPAAEDTDWRARARTYVPDDDVVEAVNVSIALGKPLLVTGEPGVGKSQLAYAMAWQLGLDQPFKFVAKSTSEARDLFYQYDALARFHAIEAARHVSSRHGSEATLTVDEDRALHRPDDPLNFIEYSALGRAILSAHPQEAVRALIADPLGARRASGTDEEDEIPGPNRRIFAHPGIPSRSVVLIDEIDKASADFCNDLLDEIDNLRFSVPEVRDRPTPPLPRSMRPLVIITSNRERELPPAFLRRCCYIDIPYPPSAQGDADIDPNGYFIETILARRIGQDKAWSALVSSAVRIVGVMRQSLQITKHPGTAELIDMVDALGAAGARFDLTLPEQPEFIETALRVLVKGPDDLRFARALRVLQPASGVPAAE